VTRSYPGGRPYEFVCILLGFFLAASSGYSSVLLDENWDSGQIDPSVWNIVISPNGATELVDLGGGDFALALADTITWESSIITWDGFARGSNLRVTFKVWGDNTRSWKGQTFPASTGLCGPWHSSYFDQASYHTLEAGLWYWWNEFTFDENRTFGQREIPDLDAFSTAWVKALSKTSSLTVRVTLGNSTGAMFEWHDGQSWHTSVDTRETDVETYVSPPGKKGHPGKNISIDPLAKVGFCPSNAWLCIDDLVIENDAASTDAVVDLRGQAEAATKKRLEKGGPTPWTHLNWNNDPNDFQFAVTSDLTGNMRRGVFMDAVKKLNLIQPEFVMSVGDYIEGMSISGSFTHRQLDEFDEKVAPLEMPFFFVPGNHDIGNATENQVWQEHYGKLYYEFVYKDVLFLGLNCEDPYTPPRFSQTQIDWVRDVLDSHQDVRWTMVFLHEAMWLYDWKTGWAPIEEMLNEREYTVFAGHNHFYTKFERFDRRYYVLAATGGGIPYVHGPEINGQFDHIMWVTMKDEGPICMNILLDGMVEDDVRTEEDARDQLEERRKVMETAAKRAGVWSK